MIFKNKIGVAWPPLVVGAPRRDAWTNYQSYLWPKLQLILNTHNKKDLSFHGTPSEGTRSPSLLLCERLWDYLCGLSKMFLLVWRWWWYTSETQANQSLILAHYQRWGSGLESELCFAWQQTVSSQSHSYNLNRVLTLFKYKGEITVFIFKNIYRQQK
jgi:hypothetical protein